MVWSDPEIRKLSREFVTAADEVYLLYPEDAGNLARVKDRPEHVFFKKFGEAMPPGAWNHPGTKQGIYMMGPNAEYLEGKFAASADAADIRARLERALKRWDALRGSAGYANKPVPAVKSALPPGVEGEIVFQVNMRDLPRGAGDRSGARFESVDRSRDGMFEFTKWAWNENWIGLPSASAFVPKGDGTEPVPAEVVARIAREVLVDNVRGQAQGWQAGDVREAVLTKRTLGVSGGTTRIEYRGRVRLEGGGRGYDASLYGEGKWNGKAFANLDLVASGQRWGASRFNQREKDPGPAPMGVSLSLHKP